MQLAAGRIIYQNYAYLSLKYFKSIGYPCPLLANPADYLMEMMSIESYDDPDHHDLEILQKSTSKIEEDYNRKIEYLQNQYENSELKSDINQIHPDAIGFNEFQEAKYSAQFLKQFYLLLIRASKSIFRLPLASYVRVLVFVVISIMIILIFGQLNTDLKSIQNRNGILFMVLASVVMSSLQGVILIFPDEKPVFLREQGEDLYSVTA